MGSRLNADYPANGVLIPRRNTIMPKHKARQQIADFVVTVRLRIQVTYALQHVSVSIPIAPFIGADFAPILDTSSDVPLPDIGAGHKRKGALNRIVYLSQAETQAKAKGG